MNFFKNNGFYKATRITGPTHNLLGLAFYESHEESSSICIEIGTDHHPISNVDLNFLKNKVLEGVLRANKEFRTNCSVARIQIVANDSLPIEIYEELAYAIVRRLAQEEKFPE